MIILFFNNFVHIFVVYYNDNVFPGDHGIAKPWYFIFQISCFSVKKKMENLLRSYSVDTQLLDSDYFEDEVIYSSRNKNLGIKINNVTKNFKEFGSIKKAVDNVTMNIFENQITVLLGNNYVLIIFK